MLNKKQYDYSKMIKMIISMIDRTKNDLIDYFDDENIKVKVKNVIQLALTNDDQLKKFFEEIDDLMPDADDDGDWKWSYAINVCSLILNLIELQTTKDINLIKEAEIAFMDTVDFKVQEIGNSSPSEAEIESNTFYIQEKEWLNKVKASLL